MSTNNEKNTLFKAQVTLKTTTYSTVEVTGKSIDEIVHKALQHNVADEADECVIVDSFPEMLGFYFKDNQSIPGTGMFDRSHEQVKEAATGAVYAQSFEFNH